jgi:hypothetical protein
MCALAGHRSTHRVPCNQQAMLGGQRTMPHRSIFSTLLPKRFPCNLAATDDAQIESVEGIRSEVDAAIRSAIGACLTETDLGLGTRYVVRYNASLRPNLLFCKGIERFGLSFGFARENKSGCFDNMFASLQPGLTLLLLLECKLKRKRLHLLAGQGSRHL